MCSWNYFPSGEVPVWQNNSGESLFVYLRKVPRNFKNFGDGLVYKYTMSAWETHPSKGERAINNGPQLKTSDGWLCNRSDWVSNGSFWILKIFHSGRGYGARGGGADTETGRDYFRGRRFEPYNIDWKTPNSAFSREKVNLFIEQLCIAEAWLQYITPKYLPPDFWKYIFLLGHFARSYPTGALHDLTSNGVMERLSFTLLWESFESPHSA